MNERDLVLSVVRRKLDGLTFEQLLDYDAQLDRILKQDTKRADLVLLARAMDLLLYDQKDQEHQAEHLDSIYAWLAGRDLAIVAHRPMAEVFMLCKAWDQEKKPARKGRGR